METLLAVLTSMMLSYAPYNATDVLIDKEEAFCLAQNVYHEAKGENLAGKSAVAHVTLNRVAHKKYPNTICGVIEEGPISKWWLKEKGKIVPIKNRCQFSWFCDGKSDEPKEKKVFSKMLDFSKSLVYDDIQIVDFTEGATHYHADYVYPAWRKTKTKTVEVADHIFYRWEK